MGKETNVFINYQEIIENIQAIKSRLEKLENKAGISPLPTEEIKIEKSKISVIEQ